MKGTVILPSLLGASTSRMTLALRFPFASYSAGVGEAEAEAGLKGKLCG